MVEIKGVQDGREPHDVLYDVVLNAPEKLYFHIGELVSPQLGLKFLLDRLMEYVTFKNGGLTFKKHGGELLTRCDPNLLPQPYIGRAFQFMPMHLMKEMFPVLLKQQLEFIATLNVVGDECYSVNLEGADHDSDVWGNVCGLLEQYGHLSLNVEVKENTLLSPKILSMLAEVCRKTRIRVYIDDLCSCCHELPHQEDYIVMLIEHLGAYIKAVKIDYLVMKEIFHLNEFHKVRKNLTDFRWLWESYSESPLPMVIFESMPLQDPRWLIRLEELARGFQRSRFQIG